MARSCGKPAIAASVLLHGTIVAALVVSIDSAAPTARGVGAAGIAVSLSSGSGAAGQAAAPAFETVDATDGPATSVPTEDTQEETPPVDPELVEATAPDNVEPPAERPVETSAPDDVESPVEKPVETPADVEPPAEKPVEAADAASETAAAAPETVAALEPELTQPTPSENGEPLPVTPRDVADVPPQTVAATTPTKTAAKKPKAAAAQAGPDAPQSAAATTSGKPSDQAPTAPTGSGVQSAAAAGAALDRNGPEGAADYIAVLQAWLEKHKQYPRRAQIRRLQGTALLYFSVDAEGHVLDFRVARSSGHTLLDAEVEAMIQRADPLPAAPANMRGARLEFVVPVQFAVR